MSAPRSRGRIVSMVAVVVLAATVLAGCAGQKDPGSYTKSVKDSFLHACWTQRVLDAEPKIKVTDNESLDAKSAAATKQAPKAVVTAAKDYCTCVRKVILKKVHFSEFKKVNDDFRDGTGDAPKLPKSFTDAYKSCKDTTSSVAASQ